MTDPQEKPKRKKKNFLLRDRPYYEKPVTKTEKEFYFTVQLIVVLFLIYKIIASLLHTFKG
jgi:cell division protein FtsL